VDTTTTQRRSFISRVSSILAVVPVALAAKVARAGQPASPVATDDTIKTMQKQMSELAREVRALKDVQEVRRLQFAYGYYIDKCLYDETVDLFADDSELYFLNGIYKGKAGVRRLYCDWFRNLFTKGYNGPIRALLLDHLQMQDIIDVAPDGLSARGRFRNLQQGGAHESIKEPIAGVPPQFWEAGIYENTYVKDAGVWKIKVLNYSMLWQANYEQGWAHSVPHLQPIMKKYPEDPHGPDELVAVVPKVWPETRVVPFHYPHPVTGKMWLPQRKA
jgi:SnoaL-like domain